MAAGTPLSLRYHSDQLNNKVTSLLREFYLTGEFCDVVLHVGNIKINAHRIVLAAFSPYFRDLFHQPSSQTNDITLRNHLREDAVRQLVDFCYSSDITVDSQSADKILTAANFLQIKEVEKLCITFLAAQQALKPEVGHQQQISPMMVPVSLPTQSPTQGRRKGNNSRELACADTSGIGSNNTSPCQSSRPSSVPSGSGSVIVQPLEDHDQDPDLDVVVVKKEREDRATDQPFFSPTSTFGSWSRPDYEGLRSSMSGYPGFFFPPVSGALSLPSTPTHHQLLMKALTQSVSGPTELGELYPGKYGLGTGVIVKDENANALSEDGEMSEMSTAHQCHLCLKPFSDIASLKTHMSEHREILTVPTASPYKMMSPVRKLSNSNQSLDLSIGHGQKDAGEEFGSSNMCGTCGKSFRDPQSLKFHRYNHVLRYQCNYCGKRFSRSWNLHRHRKTHYRQLQDTTGFGSEEVNVIDVDNDKVDTATYNLDNDKILTSPYVNYRNNRHDMMPFAFDIGKPSTSATSAFNLDTDGDKDEQISLEREKDRSKEYGMNEENENVEMTTEDSHVMERKQEDAKDVP